MIFAITPKYIPNLDIISSIEKGLKNVQNQEDVNLTRSKITQILYNAKLPSSNLNPEELQALKELRSDQSINIMKSNKGNASVVMNTTDYDRKLLNVLNDSSVYKINIKLISVIKYSER